MENPTFTFIVMSSAADAQESDTTLSTKSINRAEFQAYFAVTRPGDSPRLCVRHQPGKHTLAIESSMNKVPVQSHITTLICFNQSSCPQVSPPQPPLQSQPSFKLRSLKFGTRSNCKISTISGPSCPRVSMSKGPLRRRIS